VLTPIFVPAVMLAETSVPRIKGNRITPKTNPTRPPTKPIARPRRPKITREKTSDNNIVYREALI
jgi:hypothetical protein